MLCSPPIAVPGRSGTATTNAGRSASALCFRAAGSGEFVSLGSAEPAAAGSHDDGR
jgi:hypothetical protein